MLRQKKYYVVIPVLFMLAGYGCIAKPKGTTAETTTNVAPVNTGSAQEKSTADERQFRQFLKLFKAAVKTKNKSQLKALFNFPLQTAPEWSNDDLKNTKTDPGEGLISQTEFPAYFDEIFSRDAVKLTPASGEDDLSEIDNNTSENYYKTLQQVTDKGSRLYELQKQYTQDNGKETSFGFVFGKVGGNYKVISYYRPWPLK